MIHFSLPSERCCTFFRLLDQYIIYSYWDLQSHGSMWSARGDEIKTAGLVRKLCIALCITHSRLLSHEAALGCHCAGAKGRCPAIAPIASPRAPSHLTAEAWHRSEASADKHRGGCFSTSHLPAGESPLGSDDCLDAKILISERVCVKNWSVCVKNLLSDIHIQGPHCAPWMSRV